MINLRTNLQQNKWKMKFQHIHKLNIKTVFHKNEMEFIQWISLQGRG